MRWTALILASAGCAATPAADNFNRPFPAWVPSDVRGFVIDAQACIHFSGEESFDANRKAFLDRMMRENCTDLDKRKIELTRRYDRSKNIKDLISEAWDQ